ncbi:MAG TPA: DUF366 family protein [Planctomycetota bacterium]|nr:DUF366 family protein [Planctomycetota bacterium]
MRAPTVEFLKRPLAYDGTQIGPLWAYREFGIQGDSLLAFVGRCAIPAKHMIDLEDIRRRARIASPRMLHFIAEHFDAPPDLEKGVLRQRLFSTLVHDELRARGAEGVRREGDDLFTLREEKLSISVAAATPVSTKFHFGINVVRAINVGVKTAGLKDLKIEPEPFARALLESYRREIEGILDARTRARGAL